MSDDLVTRLRRDVDAETYRLGVEPTGMITWEAADEIERLRAELKQWQALCDTYYAKLVFEPNNTFHFVTGYRYLKEGGK